MATIFVGGDRCECVFVMRWFGSGSTVAVWKRKVVEVVIKVVVRFSRGGKVDGWKNFSWWWCDLA